MTPAAFVEDVPTAAPASRAGDARAALEGRAFDSATELAVVEAGRLVGLVPIERLLAADADAELGGLAFEAATVAPGDDLEVAARRAASRGARSVAVVDADGAFLGLVPPDRLLTVLEAEHAEDMARLGGALSASAESVRQRLWHRIPWLGLGLGGAMASALVVSGFEEELERQALLAVFVPAIVYMADAVGTQTETLVIRGMAAGARVRVAAELATGLAVGALIGAAFFAFAYAVWDNARLAGTVAIALLVSCTIATLVAMALPYGLARLGSDPAYGSGPLATVVQDLLSLLAYFGVALLLTP